MFSGSLTLFWFYFFVCLFLTYSGVPDSESSAGRKECEIFEKGQRHKMIKFVIIVNFHVFMALWIIKTFFFLNSVSNTHTDTYTFICNLWHRQLNRILRTQMTFWISFVLYQNYLIILFYARQMLLVWTQIFHTKKACLHLGSD